MKYQEHQDYQRRYQAEYQRTPKGKYAFHKSSARSRGIPFRLTFEEWWDIWQASGKWEQRGRRKDQYVMARFKDQGAYEIGNVKICLAGENAGESNTRNVNPPANRSAAMKRWWANVSEEKRDSMSRAMSENNASHRPEIRAKQSAAAKARWARVEEYNALSERNRDQDGRFAPEKKAR